MVKSAARGQAGLRSLFSRDISMTQPLPPCPILFYDSLQRRRRVGRWPPTNRAPSLPWCCASESPPAWVVDLTSRPTADAAVSSLMALTSPFLHVAAPTPASGRRFTTCMRASTLISDEPKINMYFAPPPHVRARRRRPLRHTTGNVLR
jgi:hypothetical protein